MSVRDVQARPLTQPPFMTYRLGFTFQVGTKLDRPTWAALHLKRLNRRIVIHVENVRNYCICLC